MLMPFLEAAERGGLLFDGAMGSLLYERGVFLTHCFEQVSLTQAPLVRQIHEEYLQAGARVLTSNTFGANRLKLERHGLADDLEAMNRASVKIAREVAGGRAYVAGSVGPSGLSFEQLTGPGGGSALWAIEEQIDLLKGEFEVADGWNTAAETKRLELKRFRETHSHLGARS